MMISDINGNTSSHCPSCGHAIQLRYCPACGQKNFTSRFTLSYLFYSFIESNFSFEKGALSTIYRLVYQPGVVLRGYLSGATVRYFTPLKYLFILVSISALILIGSGVYDDAISTQIQNPKAAVNAKQQAFMQNMQWVSKEMRNYMTLLSLVQLPIFAWFSLWLFKKPRLNYAEHLIVNAYALAQSNFYHVIILLFSWAIPSFLHDYWSFTSVGMLLYLAVYTQFFIAFFEYKWPTAILRTLLFYIIAMIFYIILISVGMVLVALCN